MSYAKLCTDLRDNPCVSYWLNDTIRVLHKRDPLDALNDAQLLLDIQKQRCKELGLIR